MTTHPFPAHLTWRNLGIEYFPEVEILPPLPSLRHSIDEILAVGTNCDVDAARESAQCFDRRGNLHPIVGGGSRGSRKFKQGAVTAYEHNSPSTWAGVP